MKTSLRWSPRPLALLLLCAGGSWLQGCGGGSSSAGGLAGTYTSVETDELRAEFRSDQTVVFTMAGEPGQPGRYAIDGEKVIVELNGQKLTFIRDGDCIEDQQRLFGKLCKGGAAGEKANVSTREPAPTTGTWAATNEDGTFTVTFGSGGKLSFSAVPASGGGMNERPVDKQGTFELEGDTLHVQLDDGTPLVLKWVNGAYESTAFGLPMKFTKK